MSEVMSQSQLKELLRVISTTQDPQKMIAHCKEIMQAAEKRHDDDKVSQILSELLGQWISDCFILHGDPPSPCYLKGILPTLILCCCWRSRR